MKTLHMPGDETEAAAIAAMLEANSIRFSTQSFHDTAYDGVYQGQHGWGAIKVDDADYESARELLLGWQAGVPDARDMLEGANRTPPELRNNTRPSHKTILMPVLLILSVLLNILLVAFFFSSRNGKREDYEQRDKNNFLMGRVEWGPNRYAPYRHTSYRCDGTASFISLDTNDDGRVDKLVANLPTSKETYFDRDGNGVYEVCNIEFDQGSRIEYRDRDQNGVFESATINLAGGKSYRLAFSNLNGFVLMASTPSGEAVGLDILKQIAVEL